MSKQRRQIDKHKERKRRRKRKKKQKEEEEKRNNRLEFNFVVVRRSIRRCFDFDMRLVDMSAVSPNGLF